MKKGWLALILVFSQQLYAQNKRSFLHFNINYNNEVLSLDKYYSTLLGNKLQIENIQFYISNIRFLKNSKQLSASTPKHSLINVAIDSSQLINYSFANKNEFDEIRFDIGIDSATNLSGVYGGALDPTQGMYWTWQSGYINVKIEGASDNCPARKNKFQFHLGGYAYPANTLQTVALKTSATSMIKINVNLEEFLNKINLQETYEVMSPNEQAMKLAKLFATIFTIDEH